MVVQWKNVHAVCTKRKQEMVRNTFKIVYNHDRYLKIFYKLWIMTLTLLNKTWDKYETNIGYETFCW